MTPAPEQMQKGRKKPPNKNKKTAQQLPEGHDKKATGMKKRAQKKKKGVHNLVLSCLVSSSMS